MDQQKVVVVLLLITIILSIVSVVLTVGVGDGFSARKRTALDNPDEQASIVFGLQTPPSSGVGGTG